MSSFDFRGHCYCGSVEFCIRSESIVHSSLYCHCESCRRAHSAPVYHVCYISPSDFEFTSGKEFVKNFRKSDSNSVPTRSFCSECGSRIQNTLHNKPWVGFFPATLDEELQHNLPIKFKPNMHHCGHEAVVKCERLDPGFQTKYDWPQVWQAEWKQLALAICLHVSA